MTDAILDFMLALQFLTRIPVRSHRLDPARLGRAVAWFPLVGLLIGAVAAAVFTLLVPHLPRSFAALMAVLAMVLITGGLHEDGLADSADGFGGGRTREDILRIMRDSRIGSFGAIALILSIAGRVLLLAAIPSLLVVPYLIAAQVLARCTPLPLGALVQPARAQDGQGQRLAKAITGTTVSLGITIALAIAILLLRSAVWRPVLVVAIITGSTGLYYWRRLGGVTGDCMGATIQLSEIAVYFCGAWVS